MKKILFTCLAELCTWALFSCGKYVSSYTTTRMNKVQRDDHCEMTFGSLSGRVVLQCKKTKGDGKGTIRYFGTLKSGEINVYYDTDRTPKKTPLFVLTPGQAIRASGGCIEQGDCVHIIIETVGTVKGGTIRIDLD